MPQAPAEDSFKRALVFSLALHLFLFIVFAVRAVIYPSEPMTLEDSIRVDIVALPDKKTAELPPAAAPEPAPQPKPVEAKPEPAKPEPKPEPAKPAPAPKPEAPKVNLDKTKKDQAAALKRLEALERIERMQKAQSEPTKPAAASAGETQSSTVVKGNQVSAGNSLTGLQRADHQTYLSTVKNAVKRNWNLPQWLANSNLTTRVRVYLDANGNVVKRQVMKSSGNEDFDDRVLRAIDASSPLPKPPGNLVNILAVDGFEADYSP